MNYNCSQTFLVIVEVVCYLKSEQLNSSKLELLKFNLVCVYTVFLFLKISLQRHWSIGFKGHV